MNKILVNIPFATISLRILTQDEEGGRIECQEIWLDLTFVLHLWSPGCSFHSTGDYLHQACATTVFYAVMTRGLEDKEEFLDCFQPLLHDSAVTCQDPPGLKEAKLPAHLSWKKEDLQPQFLVHECFPFQEINIFQ